MSDSGMQEQVVQCGGSFFVHESSYVDDSAVVGQGSRIWHFSHIMKGCCIGRNCNLGQNVFVAAGVEIGDNVKIQNNVSLYTGVIVEDDVFLGPSCVLTNVSNPRSQVNRQSLYERTLFRRGATVGANATIVCGVTLGRYCLIGAGAVVTRDVPDYAMMIGVPARQKGWVSRHGIPLPPPDANGVMLCPESGYRYRLTETGVVCCLDLNEEEPLPRDKAAGSISFRELRPRK